MPIEEGLDFEHGPNEILSFDGLPEVGKGPYAQSALRLVAAREDLDGDVAKFNIVLEVVKERPPFHVR